jgi:membrane protein YdbS with pleckstrin-like domain
MKNKNYSPFYGILFYFMYVQIYIIVSSVLIVPILIMRWNIHSIPVCLIAVVTLFSVWFYKLKQFPEIRFWYILLVFILTTIANLICTPGFYLKGENYEYHREHMSMILNYNHCCMITFTIVFLSIAYIKYFKTGKDEKFIINDNV